MIGSSGDLVIGTTSPLNPTPINTLIPQPYANLGWIGMTIAQPYANLG